MFISRRFLIVLAIILLLPVIVLAAKSYTDVFVFGTNTVIEGASSSINRNNNNASVQFKTTADAGTYTVWAVIWNNPDACIQPPPYLVEGQQCGEDDLGGEGTEFSLGIVTGGVVGNNGVANFAGKVPAPGSGSVLLGGGLTDPQGAEVHLVLRYHGPKIQGHVSAQTHTFGGGCSNDSLIGTPGEGTGLDEGGFDCIDVQAAIHAP